MDNRIKGLCDFLDAARSVYHAAAYIGDTLEDAGYARLYEQDARIRRCVDALVDGTLDDGGTGLFAELRTALLEGASWHAPDHYYVLGDFHACLEMKKRVAKDYARDRRSFAAKQWRNLCAAGVFSADRAIREYAKEIWKL